MWGLLLVPAVLLLAPVAPDPQPGDSSEPVTFEFHRQCGPDKGRTTAYDPKTRSYFLQVHDIARFNVKSVAKDLDKCSVVLHISGMLDRPEGPLTLSVTLANAKSKVYELDHRNYDKELFRIERENGVTTIEFLPKGKALLSPGTGFQYIDFYRN